MGQKIYKIFTRAQWDKARAEGVFTGAPVDLADGYIHCSSAEQVRGTADRHFEGQPDLVLARIDTRHLGDTLRWEISRGGQLFPHLYDTLSIARVEAWFELPLGPDGRHHFPAEIP